MSEDDDIVEPCPLCKHKKCEKHVLACFDRAGDDGAFGLGLLGGALCHVNEIEVAMEHARLAWVRSVRATGKPKAPQWIMKDFGLQQYFDALGRSVSGGKVDFDVGKYKSDEDAADDLQADTDRELWHGREDFLWEDLSRCDSFVTTEEETVLTTLVIWWAWERARSSNGSGQNCKGFCWKPE